MYHINALFKHFDVESSLLLLFYFVSSNAPRNVYLASVLLCFVPHSLLTNPADFQWCLFESEQGNIEHVAQSGALCHLWVCFTWISSVSSFDYLKFMINSLFS